VDDHRGGQDAEADGNPERLHMSTTDAPAPAVLSQSDLLDIDSLLSDDERAVRDRVRAFAASELRPHVDGWYEAARFSPELPERLGEQGLLGMHLKGYGCAGRSAVEYGLANLEVEAVDSGVRTLVSVQGSLAMSAIWHFGSEDQKQEWLPAMAAGRSLGCFALTEPGAGSDPGSMATTARREGGDWVLRGSKHWIGMGTLADVAVVWARTDDGVRGFLVPAGTPGFEARDISGKMSMRTAVQSGLTLDDCRLPESSMLPDARGLRGPFTCLDEARYGIAWGAMGAARACCECALEHSRRRVQFGKPIAQFQLTQRKLVDMVVKVQLGTLLALHLGRMKDERGLRPEQVSFGKLNNVREALWVARESRSILGGDGVTSRYPVMRHMANLESVLTYEGTNEVHTLVLGHALTGLPAFR